MRCYHPINIRDPNGVGHLAPCGRCIACLLNKQRSWEQRLVAEEYKHDFILWKCFTYDDNYLQYKSGHIDGELVRQPIVVMEHVRTFLESFRKWCKRHGYKVKHFISAEYSPDAHRPHYHACFFVDCLNPITPDTKALLGEEIQKLWPYGFVLSKDFHSGVFSYVTGYCEKPEKLLKDYKPLVPVFKCISQGFGTSLLQDIDTFNMIEENDFTYYYKGHRTQLPRYLRDKIGAENPELYQQKKEQFLCEDFQARKHERDKYLEKHDSQFAYKSKLMAEEERLLIHYRKTNKNRS